MELQARKRVSSEAGWEQEQAGRQRILRMTTIRVPPSRDVRGPRRAFARTLGGCALLSILALLFAEPGLQARHWRHHGHHGRHAGESSFDMDREWPDPRAGPPALRDVGFGRGLDQVIGGCRQEAAELKSQSFDTLAQILGLTDGQRAALDQVRSVSAQAADALSSACPSDAPATLSSRIEALTRVAQAYVAAIDAVRPGMEEFYGLLNDEQKAHLIALQMSDHDTARRDTPQAVATSNQFCQRWAQNLRDWPTRRIEASLSLSDTQHAALLEAAAAMYRAASTLANSCPNEVSFTPLGHFDAKRKQVAALLAAIDAVRPVVDRFSDSLDQAQRAVLDAVVGSS